MLPAPIYFCSWGGLSDSSPVLGEESSYKWLSLSVVTTWELGCQGSKQAGGTWPPECSTWGRGQVKAE